MKAGDKVVCVDDVFEEWALRKQSVFPVAGKTYVIRSVGYWQGEYALRLVGIPCAFHAPSGTEHGFAPRRFRKLEELKAEAKLRQQKEQPAPAKP